MMKLLFDKFSLSSLHSSVIACLLVVEIVFCVFIVSKVAYTEIDWVAYMQETKYFLDGERNYTVMKGDTGPLVYPAGFLYVFSVLYEITNKGADIHMAQMIFVGIYALVLGSVLYLYGKGKRVPLWSVGLLVVSKRIHSIFVLRMFNDCIAVLCGYVALSLFINQQWKLGSLVYSFAVSIKMNMLLQAPGLLLVFLLSLGWWDTFVCLSICAITQLVLGYPFLSTFPAEYLKRSFDIGRVFMHIWTVNLKFLPEGIFIRKELGIVLLILTLVVMLLFGRKWIYENFPNTPGKLIVGPKRKLSAHFVIMTLFVSNFIGVVFARSLHYQFYVWYFHMLPYLVFSSLEIVNTIDYVRVFTRLCWLGMIEYAFNVYPATPISSVILQAAHFSILYAIYRNPAPKVLDDSDVVYRTFSPNGDILSDSLPNAKGGVKSKKSD